MNSPVEDPRSLEAKTSFILLEPVVQGIPEIVALAAEVSCETVSAVVICLVETDDVHEATHVVVSRKTVSSYVILFVCNRGETAVNGLLLPAVMDGVIAAWCLLYFAALRRGK